MSHISNNCSSTSGEHESLRQWLERFRLDWESGEVDGFGNGLFDDQATYQWGPFSEIAIGLAAIRDYKMGSIEGACSWYVKFELVAVADNKVVVRWQVRSQVDRTDESGVYEAFEDAILIMTFNDRRMCNSLIAWPVVGPFTKFQS